MSKKKAYGASCKKSWHIFVEISRTSARSAWKLKPSNLALRFSSQNKSPLVEKEIILIDKSVVTELTFSRLNLMSLRLLWNAFAETQGDISTLLSRKAIETRNFRWSPCVNCVIKIFSQLDFCTLSKKKVKGLAGVESEYVNSRHTHAQQNAATYYKLLWQNSLEIPSFITMITEIF